ncbi:hypothetical protein [Flavobacterium sp. H122]|uniref:hypothetical protein n=1 Tax=Flavobacterium sp. H122 TaxID=2529860 RepID=UPI0010AB308C|nr:hypothetical protein [Flavobacterium sp. H122]
MKKITFLILIGLLISNCKKDDTYNNRKAEIQKTDSVNNRKTAGVVKTDKENTAEEKKSFVFSCGTECAIVFDEISRERKKNTVEIKYAITQYVNDNVETEFQEVYFFEADGNGKLISIHSDKNKVNILNDDSFFGREKFIEIGMELFPKGIANLNDSKETELVTENKPYSLMSLPFDLKDYINNLPNEIKNSYTPADRLKDYLVSKGYDGEKYKCFFLKTDDNDAEIIVSITRGDSEYFLLVTVSAGKFTSYKEIGSVGEETKYFKIDKNFKVITY